MRLCARRIWSCANGNSSADQASLHQKIEKSLMQLGHGGVYCSSNAMETTVRALDLGADVGGGIPHFERILDNGRRSVTKLGEIAEQRGLPVDMHHDETDDPHSRHIAQLIHQTQRQCAVR